MVAGVPHQGGASWAVLQYVLGLRELGYRNFLVEAVTPAQLGGRPLARSASAAYFRRVVAEFALHDHAALLLDGTRETFGLPYDALLAAARDADLLLNVSGLLTNADLLGPIPRRAY